MKYVPLFLFFLSQTLFAQPQLSEEFAVLRERMPNLSRTLFAQSQLSDEFAALCDRLANPPPGVIYSSPVLTICREGVEKIKKIEAEGGSSEQIIKEVNDTNKKMSEEIEKEIDKKKEVINKVEI